MIVLGMAELLAEAEGASDLQFHFRAIFRISAPALRFPIDRHCKGIVASQLLQILANALSIAVFLCFKFAAYLIAEFEGNALIDHSLSAQHIPVVVSGNVDIGKDLLVRLPVKQ